MTGIAIFFNACLSSDIWRYHKIRNIWGNFGSIKEIKLVAELCFFLGGVFILLYVPSWQFLIVISMLMTTEDHFLIQLWKKFNYSGEVEEEFLFAVEYHKNSNLGKSSFYTLTINLFYDM